MITCTFYHSDAAPVSVSASLSQLRELKNWRFQDSANLPSCGEQVELDSRPYEVLACRWTGTSEIAFIVTMLDSDR